MGSQEKTVACNYISECTVVLFNNLYVVSSKLFILFSWKKYLVHRTSEFDSFKHTVKLLTSDHMKIKDTL
jgi:hypothetical protein